MDCSFNCNLKGTTKVLEVVTSYSNRVHYLFIGPNYIWKVGIVIEIETIVNWIFVKRNSFKISEENEFLIPACIIYGFSYVKLYIAVALWNPMIS